MINIENYEITDEFKYSNLTSETQKASCKGVAFAYNRVCDLLDELQFENNEVIKEIKETIIQEALGRIENCLFEIITNDKEL